MEQIQMADPTVLMEGPKVRRKMMYSLCRDRKKIISVIDLSTPEGGRNKGILETMYSCGLVPELVNLRINNLYLDVGFIRYWVKE